MYKFVNGNMEDAINTDVISLVLPVSCDGYTDDEFFNAVCKRFPRVREVYDNTCESYKKSKRRLGGVTKAVPIKKSEHKYYGSNNILLTFVHNTVNDEENIIWDNIKEAFWNIHDHHPYSAFYMKPEYKFTEDECAKFHTLFKYVFCDMTAVIYEEGATERVCS